MRKRKIPEKTVYYKDPLNDEFSGTNIHRTVVGDNFKYIHKNPLWRATAFLVYFLIVVPVVWFFERVLRRVKYVNRKALKKVRKQKCFFYGNHTRVLDVFTSSLMVLPKRSKVVADPDSASLKGLKNLIQMLGALPLPTTKRGMMEFVKAMDYYQEKFHIVIYPEAHVWPFYTGVRPFTSASFRYPVKYDAPVIAFFTVYTEPKGFLARFRKANRTIYLSDPIYPDEGLSPKEAQQNLRDKVYAFMMEKSKLSTYKVIEYIQEEQNVCE
ncbi:MAG: hypothetical protein IJ329_03140 [Clostridia bacterium]|nr:hypothetical protein [Clostridia bacterium]